MNIPILLNTFSKRSIFLDVFFYFYKKNTKEKLDIYLAIDNENYTSTINTDINLLYYSDIKETDAQLHETHSRYYRHYYSLMYLKSIGHEYVLNYGDDAWISYLNYDMLLYITKYFSLYDADRIDISGLEPSYELLKENDEISIINPNNTITWYHTNQPCIWKIDSLINLYELLGPSSDTDVERKGSDLCRSNNYKFLYSNEIIIKEKGLFQRNIGFNTIGINMLKEYCDDTNSDFNSLLDKFNKFK